MTHPNRYRLISTVKDRCRVCYTCVKECPVKAIRIRNGQAELIKERCIGCGNCVKVCSQGAKAFMDNRADVLNLLESRDQVIACLAPSFAAEFNELKDYRVLIGMLRMLGFSRVVEVSFGADLVARQYAGLLEKADRSYITSDCPALVNYVESYCHPLVNSLAPLTSPMVTTVRVVKEKYGREAATVFIGPCIAKKAESTEVDVVITFRELRALFEKKTIDASNTLPAEFDPPFAGRGAIFPVSRGLLQNIESSDDIVEGRVLVAEGRVNFRDAIREFEEGNLGIKHLELLCCEGCIMGPGMSIPGKRYFKRTCITRYVKEKMKNLEEGSWSGELESFGNLDLSRRFCSSDRTKLIASEEAVSKALESMGKISLTDHLNCAACGYDTCLEHAIAIAKGLAETEMCLPYTLQLMHRSIQELNTTNLRLAKTKQALKHSEKLAHMGQLSAGIAHELNNPLGIITMYSNLLLEETPADSQMRKDLELIVEQTDRCSKIVGGLLNFARKNQVNLEKTLVPEFVRHSLRSVITPPEVSIRVCSTLSDPLAMIDHDQMTQALTNLVRNATEAMPSGGNLTISLSGDEENLEIKVADTGTGIPPENMQKIFTPFFTTKKMGKGTGLGLPLVYGIIKMHLGQITVSSNKDPEKGPTGTEFRMILPRRKEMMEEEIL